MDAATGIGGETKETQISRGLLNFIEGLSDSTLLVSSPDLTILFANPQARIRYSHCDSMDVIPLEVFVNQTFPDVNFAKVREVFAQLSQASNPEPSMYFLNESGKRTHVRISSLPFEECSCGGVDPIFAVTLSDPDFDAIRDNEERKRLEDELIENRNLVMLGSLVSGIAHEIKNPLGILMSSVEIVLNEKRPEEQRREAASYIKDEVRRLDERMKYFLAFARPKPLMREAVDVGDIIRKVANSYQGAACNKQFHVQPPMCSHLPRTLADPDLLHQVFLNLIINAEHACPGGGVLVIRADVMENSIRIQFLDNGQGISHEDLDKIFDPFFTTKSSGTGLGLSIVHQIITSHRGKISARNNNEKPGVVIEILLPVTEDV